MERQDGHFLSLFSSLLPLCTPVSRKPGWNQRKCGDGQGVYVASLDHPPAGAALGRPRTTLCPEGAFLLPRCHHEDAGVGGRAAGKSRLGLRSGVVACLAHGQSLPLQDLIFLPTPQLQENKNDGSLYTPDNLLVSIMFLLTGRLTFRRIH